MNHSLKAFFVVLILSNLRFSISQGCSSSQCLVDTTCTDISGKCGLPTEQCQDLSIVAGSIKIRKSSIDNSCVSVCETNECIVGGSTNYTCGAITNSKCGSTTSICEDIDSVVDGGYKVRTSSGNNACTADCGDGNCILTSGGVSYCAAQVSPGNGSLRVRSKNSVVCTSSCAADECIVQNSTNYQCTTITNSQCGSNTNICEDIDLVVDGGYKVRTSNTDNTCTSSCGTGECFMTDAGISYCTSQQGLGSDPIRIRSIDSDLCVSTCDPVVDQIVCQNFSLPSFKCDVASSTLFYNATADGVQKVCLTECSTFKCAHPTTFQCMTPESGKVFISSSQVCAANCSSVNPKCFDDNFICVNPDNEHLSKNNGSACIAEITGEADKCPVTEHCMNLLNFTCSAPSLGQFKEAGNYYCVTKCSDESKCEIGRAHV